jgi:hypothetical protein
MTFAECWNRLANKADSASAKAAEGGSEAAATKAAKSDATKEVAKKTTGSEALTPTLSSSITDFLSPLSAMVGLRRTTTDAGDIAFDGNGRVATKKDRWLVMKYGGLVRKPSVYKEIQEKIPETTRDARVAVLAKGFGDLDDVHASVTFASETPSKGRNAAASDLLSSYLAELVGLDSAVDEDRVLARLVNPPPKGCDPLVDKLGTCFQTDASFKAAVRKIKESADLTTGRIDALRERVRDARLDVFNDLLSNQPQLTFELYTDVRNELAGPDQFGAKVRYEGSLSPNVNDLRNWCETRGGATLDCFENYINGIDPKQSNRYFVAFEAFNRNAYSFQSLPDSINLNHPKTWGIVASAGLGLYVIREGQQGRLEFSGQAFYTKDEPARQNRVLFSATYTQKVSGGMSLVAGVSWASKPEFLSDVQKKLSGQVGLRYKLSK